ncbi:DUF262 domain-containing protein [Pseudomonas sp. RC2C2]|uniref:DUF262 domain-containing protein n=1 Tax=Pseudomonas sp. RC2C2 TaxID=2834408 RepID=UPI001BD12F63|nr:DUF262 domain-containing protein [Pseudomonas sp. RC2C2]MBS7596932.1 DUF262 domain-containing protein [Pseudomonas sp. RC2C2]
MDTSASNRRLRVLLTAIGNGTLIPQPEFQRRLVWINKDKIEFIRTVLEGYPFPEIYIAAGKVDTKTGEGAEMLVDGQQRITTLYQYFRGSADLRLPKDFPRYDKLPEGDQVRFLEYKVVVRDLGNMSIDQIKQVFQRINSTSYGLNAMEIHNARYGGEFKKFAEKISQLEFFDDYRVFTSTDVKRMNDVMYCASLTATVMSTYFNRDSEVEIFLEKFNEEFDAQELLLKNIEKVLTFISRLNFPPKSRIYKKADFFTLFVEIYKILITANVDLNIPRVRSELETFFNHVDIVGTGLDTGSADVERYYKAALQASNDRGNRIARGEIISKTLRNTI